MDHFILKTKCMKCKHITWPACSPTPKIPPASGLHGNSVYYHDVQSGKSPGSVLIYKPNHFCSISSSALPWLPSCLLDWSYVLWARRVREDEQLREASASLAGHCRIWLKHQSGWFWGDAGMAVGWVFLSVSRNNGKVEGAGAATSTGRSPT